MLLVLNLDEGQESKTHWLSGIIWGQRFILARSRCHRNSVTGLWLYKPWQNRTRACLNTNLQANLAKVLERLLRLGPTQKQQRHCRESEHIIICHARHLQIEWKRRTAKTLSSVHIRMGSVRKNSIGKNILTELRTTIDCEISFCVSLTVSDIFGYIYTRCRLKSRW